MGYNIYIIFFHDSEFRSTRRPHRLTLAVMYIYIYIYMCGYKIMEQDEKGGTKNCNGYELLLLRWTQKYTLQIFAMFSLRGFQCISSISLQINWDDFTRALAISQSDLMAETFSVKLFKNFFQQFEFKK